MFMQQHFVVQFSSDEGSHHFLFDRPSTIRVERQIASLIIKSYDNS